MMKLLDEIKAMDAAGKLLGAGCGFVILGVIGAPFLFIIILVILMALGVKTG